MIRIFPARPLLSELLQVIPPPKFSLGRKTSTRQSVNSVFVLKLHIFDMIVSWPLGMKCAILHGSADEIIACYFRKGLS